MEILRVPTYALMKKGLRLASPPMPPNQICSNLCPDEEGIETQSLQYSKTPQSVPTYALMKKGLRHQIRLQTGPIWSSNLCPDEEGIETSL